MSNYILHSAWKSKMKIKNIFGENFLNEKDIALQPISFIEIEDNKNLFNNIVVKNKKERKENKEKKEYKEKKNKAAHKAKKENPKKNSLKRYDSYNSNIVIVQSMIDSSEVSSNDLIGKEVEKLKKIILRSKTKNKKSASNSKVIKASNSGLY